MNLLLLDPGEVDDEGRVRLEERRAQHLLRVLGVEPGQRVRAGLVDGPVGSAEVLETTKRTVVLRFESSADEASADEASADETVAARPAPEGEVDLVVGLPRPQVLHRVLQTAASMEVRRLDLVNAWRVEKSFFQSPSLSDEKIRYQLLLGAEQGMSTRLPTVQRHKLLVPFLESLSASAPDASEAASSSPAPSAPLRLIAHPDADATLEAVVWEAEAVWEVGERGSGPARSVQLAIGPEGGWIDREVESFGAAGFRPVRLGRWILRVEVALAVALGQLAAARRSAPPADRSDTSGSGLRP